MFGCPDSISMLSGCDSQSVAPDSEGGDGGSLDKLTGGPALSESSGLIKKPQLNEGSRGVG